jgi:hypothetical protein
MKKVIIILTAALAIHAQAQSFLTNGLTAHYPFNGNADDASGNGNHGVVNGTTLTTDRFGFANSAYRFNGSSWIQLPDAVEPVQPSELTLSMWILADGGANTAGAWLIHLSSRTGENGILLWNANSWGYWVKLQSSQDFSANGDLVVADGWAHLVAVYKQGQYMQYWVNGVLVQTNALPNSPLYAGSSFPLNSSIGNYDFAPAPYNGFTGSIDDVRVYNRALAPSEVQQLFNAPPTVNCPSEAFAECGASTQLTAQVSDPEGAAMTVVWTLNGTSIQTNYVPATSPGTAIDVSLTGSFPLGTNTVAIGVSDGANAAACVTSVTVFDTAPPTLSNVTPAPNVLWPPNNKMIAVTLQALAADTCSPASWRIIGVRSSDSLKGQSSQTSSPDWDITGDHTLLLRARCLLRSVDRKYYVTVQATDASGNKSQLQTVTVTVPRSYRIWKQ